MDHNSYKQDQQAIIKIEKGVKNNALHIPYLSLLSISFRRIFSAGKQTNCRYFLVPSELSDEQCTFGLLYYEHHIGQMIVECIEAKTTLARLSLCGQ